MSDIKVVRLVDRQSNPNTLSWDAKDMLLEVVEDIEDGRFPRKVIVIGLDDIDGKFVADWRKAGLLNSEAISVIELVKYDSIKLLMGD